MGKQIKPKKAKNAKPIPEEPFHKGFLNRDQQWQEELDFRRQVEADIQFHCQQIASLQPPITPFTGGNFCVLMGRGEYVSHNTDKTTDNHQRLSVAVPSLDGYVFAVKSSGASFRDIGEYGFPDGGGQYIEVANDVEVDSSTVRTIFRPRNPLHRTAAAIKDSPTSETEAYLIAFDRLGLKHSGSAGLHTEIPELNRLCLQMYEEIGEFDEKKLRRLLNAGASTASYYTRPDEIGVIEDVAAAGTYLPAAIARRLDRSDGEKLRVLIHPRHGIFAFGSSLAEAAGRTAYIAAAARSVAGTPDLHRLDGLSVYNYHNGGRPYR